MYLPYFGQDLDSAERVVGAEAEVCSEVDPLSAGMDFLWPGRSHFRLKRPLVYQPAIPGLSPFRPKVTASGLKWTLVWASESNILL